jgi:CheY-like chemotaxis protein
MEVIVVTGNADTETSERCEAYGATYVVKSGQFWNDIRAALIEYFPEKAVLKEKTLPRLQIRRRPMLLIVDDDPSVGRFLISRLDKLGLDCILAQDGVSGFLAAAREKPNVILSDYFMPNGDATYLLRKLRNNPSTVNTPVVVMSGRDIDKSAQVILHQRVNDHPGISEIIVKSSDIHSIFSSLSKYFPLVSKTQ